MLGILYLPDHSGSIQPNESFLDVQEPGLAFNAESSVMKCISVGAKSIGDC